MRESTAIVQYEDMDAQQKDQVLAVMQKGKTLQQAVEEVLKKQKKAENGQ